MSEPKRKKLNQVTGYVSTARLEFRDWVTDSHTGFSILVEKWSDGQIHVLDERTPAQNEKDIHE